MSEKRLLGFKCNNCGNKVYPERPICPRCKEREFSEFELGDIGTILTYTKLYAVPEGVEVRPLILGVAEFDGLRIAGQLIGEDIKIGDKVQPVWGELRKSQGKEVYGFKFEKIK